MKSPKQIIKEAVARFKPVLIVLMVSGGHDSITNAHVSATALQEMGLPFVVYHGDTTIGIPETQQYVKDMCKRYGWKLFIGKPSNPKDCYEALVKKFGFPGPTRMSHQIMYRHLKERALNYFVTHQCKTTPYARENVLLLSGLRKMESRVRVGYTREVNKENSKVWVNPIFYFSDSDVREYMSKNGIPKNPVKEKICISGECLCGAFAGKEEWTEIKLNYPKVAAEIERLHEIAKANGHPWPWSMGPTEWRKNEAGKVSKKPAYMCVGCDNKRDSKDDILTRLGNAKLT